MDVPTNPTRSTFGSWLTASTNAGVASKAAVPALFAPYGASPYTASVNAFAEFGSIEVPLPANATTALASAATAIAPTMIGFLMFFLP
jgi:hypothetical protein